MRHETENLPREMEYAWTIVKFAIYYLHLSCRPAGSIENPRLTAEVLSGGGARLGLQVVVEACPCLIRLEPA